MADIELVQVVRVIALDEEATEPEAGQYLLVDTADGTKKMQVNNLLRAAGLSDEAKTALLDCFAHVAWVDEHGQDYYDALEDALYSVSELTSITAVFNQGSAIIYDTDTLDTLKQYLTVTANYSDGTTQTVTNYALSGTLTEGTSTITASYGGKTDTFEVTVTDSLLYSWDFTQSLVDSVSGKTATTTATRNSNGVTFNAFDQYIDLNTSFERDMTAEIDVDYIQNRVNTDIIYRRLFCVGDNGTITSQNTAAFVFGRGDEWRMYMGSEWDDDVGYGSAYSSFNGKTVKIYIAADGKVKVSAKTIGASDSTYTLIGTSTKSIKNFTAPKAYIAGNGYDCLASARIKGVRIYEGEK